MFCRGERTGRDKGVKIAKIGEKGIQIAMIKVERVGKSKGNADDFYHLTLGVGKLRHCMYKSGEFIDWSNKQSKTSYFGKAWKNSWTRMMTYRSLH